MLVAFVAASGAVIAIMAVLLTANEDADPVHSDDVVVAVTLRCTIRDFGGSSLSRSRLADRTSTFGRRRLGDAFDDEKSPPEELAGTQCETYRSQRESWDWVNLRLAVTVRSAAGGSYVVDVSPDRAVTPGEVWRP
ncbi:MAG: hypothetical protein IT303_03885 [Dehalococcoidia bacterium]|nr:hypothetical protein [Dehalococcoidia bacterium]